MHKALKFSATEEKTISIHIFAMDLTMQVQFQRHSLAFQINRDKVKFVLV